MKEYRFKINGNGYDVTINGISDNVADVTVNGENYKVEIENGTTAQAPQPVPGAAAQPSSVAARTPASGAKLITSPLPGVIVEISVNVGQAVKSGQKVAVLEAMKMENEILAECDGTVTAIHVSKGDSILEGAEIVSIG